MTESIRLVIWDLDETFWKGTLSEGPITHIPETRAMVTELARRGIVSSICSKNDFEPVRAALEAAGMWDYFIFPSISWEPKGPRIAALIEAVQLRPETVLFIDDNPSNLEEVRHFNQHVQLAGLDILPRLLDDSLFAGKSDPELSRLRQYQALERRKADATSAPGGLEEFLRRSDIRVRIVYDLEKHLDRIVELINRTNQLNFTKRRLAENPLEARAQLTELLHSHDIQAGLLHVTDRYGDHGYSGFYLLKNGVELLHYCFSCRILGMGVETWLYRRLERPHLAVGDGVLSNPKATDSPVNWITLEESTAPDRGSRDGGVADSRFNWVAARGGCDLQALSHYFKMTSPEVFGEFNVGRGGFDARVDHSIFLRYAVTGIDPEAIAEANKIGYRAEDFKTTLNQVRPGGAGLLILSFWADVAYALYRHRKLGFALPFALSGRANHAQDARQATPDEMPENLRNGWMATALRTLQSDYDYLGIINEALFKENLRFILDALPQGVPVVLLKGNTTLLDREHGVTHTSSDNINFNRWMTEVAEHYPAAYVVNIRDVISSEAQVLDWSHFDRIVYYRLYERICDVVRSNHS